MKILQIISDGYLCGGAEKSVVMLRDELTARGHEVQIMSSDLGPAGERFSDYTFPHITGGPWAVFRKHLYYRASRRCLDRVLADFQPDVVHLHTLGELSPSVPLGLRKVPTILTVHGPEEYVEALVPWYQPDTDFHGGQAAVSHLNFTGQLRYLYYTKLQKILYRRAFRHFAAIVTPSQYMQREVERERFGPRVQQIYNGVILPPATKQRRTNQLLYVGRLEAVKGVDYLLRALKLLDGSLGHTRLVIIGDGRARADLEGLTDELGLVDRVEFRGWLSASELWEAYADATLVVIPSVWPENLPTVAIEAQAAGRPIVATNVGGISEIVGPDTGLLVPPADEKALARALMKVLLDPALAQSMSLAAIRLSKRFAIDTFTTNIERLYEESLPRHNVLITHAYHSGSNGDAALAAMTIAAVREQYPGANIQLSSMEAPTTRSMFAGVPNIGSVTLLSEHVHRALIIRLLNKGYLLIVPLIWALGRRWHLRLNGLLTRELKEILEQYETADLIIGCAGGYLTSPPGWSGDLNIMFLVSDFAIGLILGKPLVLYSQSIGPFGSRWQRSLVSWVLRRAQVVMVREGTSASFLKTISGVRAHQTVDAAFGLMRPERGSIAQYIPEWGNDGYQYVGLTAREFLDSAAQLRYEQALVEFIDTQTATGNYRFVLIPQVVIPEKQDDDRIIHARIYAGLKHPEAVAVLRDVFDYQSITRLYAAMDYLVGTRFHSAIFSMLADVPILAIEYEYKTSGIMRDLGLAEWVLPMQGLTSERLTKLFEALVESRRSYLGVLRPAIDETRRRAQLDRRLITDSGVAD